MTPTSRSSRLRGLSHQFTGLAEAPQIRITAKVRRARSRSEARIPVRLGNGERVPAAFDDSAGITGDVLHS